MRSIRRLLVAGLTVLTLVGCASTTPGWTDAPASPSAALSAGASGSAAPPASGAPSASASAAPSATASAAGSLSAPPSASAATTVAQLTAQNIAFDPTELSVAADNAFQIKFDNNDNGIPHNVEIKDASGASIFKGEIFPGVDTRAYDVQALPAGSYQFVCSVHANMTGTLTSQ